MRRRQCAEGARRAQGRGPTAPSGAVGRGAGPTSRRSQLDELVVTDTIKLSDAARACRQDPPAQRRRAARRDHPPGGVRRIRRFAVRRLTPIATPARAVAAPTLAWSRVSVHRRREAAQCNESETTWQRMKSTSNAAQSRARVRAAASVPPARSRPSSTVAAWTPGRHPARPREGLAGQPERVVLLLHPGPEPRLATSSRSCCATSSAIRSSS